MRRGEIVKSGRNGKERKDDNKRDNGEYTVGRMAKKATMETCD